MLSTGYTLVLEIVWVVVWPLVVEVEPCLNTMSDESEISADALPFLLAFALEFCDEVSLVCWEP